MAALFLDIACFVLVLLKTFELSFTDLSFSWDECYHQVICLRLTEPNWAPLDTITAVLIQKKSKLPSFSHSKPKRDRLYLKQVLPPTRRPIGFELGTSRMEDSLSPEGRCVSRVCCRSSLFFFLCSGLASMIISSSSYVGSQFKTFYRQGQKEEILMGAVEEGGHKKS